eukprot:1160533-Pelagomonas_calceolata.AAC.17
MALLPMDLHDLLQLFLQQGHQLCLGGGAHIKDLLEQRLMKYNVMSYNLRSCCSLQAPDEGPQPWLPLKLQARRITMQPNSPAAPQAAAQAADGPSSSCKLRSHCGFT